MSVDTLSYVKRLEAAGVPRPQAEAHAEALRDEVAPQLATSVDLGGAVDRLDNAIATATTKLEAKLGTEANRLEAKIDRESARLDGRLSTVEARLQMMQWMVGLNLAATLGVLWKLLR